MALEKNNNAVFLSIGSGKITKRVKTPTESSVSRTIKDTGAVIHEEIYDSVSGMITDIKTHKHEIYGRFWNVSIEDGGERYTLQMNYSGGYSAAFLKQLPNVDFSKRVTIIPSTKVIDGRKSITVFIRQNDEVLKHFYKKGDGKLPEWKQVKVKGELVWDDTEMMDFLENMVNTTILPKLKAQPAPAEADDDSNPPF